MTGDGVQNYLRNVIDVKTVNLLMWTDTCRLHSIGVELEIEFTLLMGSVAVFLW